MNQDFAELTRDALVAQVEIAMCRLAANSEHMKSCNKDDAERVGELVRIEAAELASFVETITKAVTEELSLWQPTTKYIGSGCTIVRIERKA